MKIANVALFFAASLSLASVGHAGTPGESVQDYAETLNRLFVHDGVGVTVGPEDGHIGLTFAPFELKADGTAEAVVKRFDRDLQPQWQDLDLILRKNDAGTFEFGIKRAGQDKYLTYDLKKIDDTHIQWFNGVVIPFKNDYTNGKWEIEIGSFDIHLDAAGRTVYSIDDTKYYLKDDYVAAHYTVVTPTEGQAFLRDASTGVQLSYWSEDVPQLVDQGVADGPVVEHLDWKQIAP